jgi:hypothetical protein
LAAPWQGHQRRRGAAVVLILVPIVVGTRQEPTFDVAAIEVLTYYRSPHTPATQLRSFVLTVGLITFVWFVVALTTLLRRAEGEAPWRSAVAMGSGVLFVALVLSGNEVAAAFRADDVDPQIDRYAFDEGQVAFATPGWPLAVSPSAAAGLSPRPDSSPAGWDGSRSQAE